MLLTMYDKKLITKENAIKLIESCNLYGEKLMWDHKKDIETKNRSEEEEIYKAIEKKYNYNKEIDKLIEKEIYGAVDVIENNPIKVINVKTKFGKKYSKSKFVKKGTC